MSHVQAIHPPISASVADGSLIPALKRDEAMTMSAEELSRFIALIGTLAEEDWHKQTACSLWTVKDIVAHQAAHVVGFTSFRSFASQLNPARLRPYLKRGMSMLDAWNQSQVDLRSAHSPADLVAEIRDAAQRSLRGRGRIPGFLRAPALPLPGLDQPRSMGYVFDVTYTRDMWMHRYDICAATGRSMPMDAKHDGRMVALIIRDLAQKAQRGLHGRSALLEVTGIAGGTYHLGAGTSPAATITLDVPTLCVLTSGREKASNVLTDSRASVTGDPAFGRMVVNFCENRVLY